MRDENFSAGSSSSGADETPENDDSSTDENGAKSPESGDAANSQSDKAPENGPTAGTEKAASAPRRARRPRWRRVALWTAACLALTLTAGIVTAYGYYYSLRSGMDQHDLESLLTEEERPDQISDAVNVLFIGSDGYEEGGSVYQEEFEGERSDALMLAHISPDKRVSVVNFPRDSLVQVPACDAYAETDGTYGGYELINTALYHGGPPCVIRTIESLTDIRIDHFVHLSFMSFRDVVDAIGGVEICIPEPIEDDRADLDLDAGDQTLDGEEALSFVRARYEVGDGGDIGRIDRQQMFLAALADQVTSEDVLTSPGKLNRIAEAVAKHSATDQELTLNQMLSIAVTLTEVDLSNIEFHTVPWYQAPSDPNRVIWNKTEAEMLFSALREGRPLPALSSGDDATAPPESPHGEPDGAEEEEEPGAAAGAEEPDATEEEAAPEPEEGSQSARPGEGRDATSNPCDDGLGFGTGDDEEMD